MDQNTIKWLKICFVIYFLVTLTMGFFVGYFFKVKNENKSILTSDLKKMNKANNAYFTCSCISNTPEMSTFTFDEEKIYQNNIF